LPPIGSSDGEHMKAFAVSTYVNDARHDGPECVVPMPA
jgi:hypothetical protein